MSNNELRNQLSQVKKDLIAKGWTYQYSVMNDGDGINYGSCFTKDGHKLYLNKDTVDAYAISLS